MDTQTPHTAAEAAGQNEGAPTTFDQPDGLRSFRRYTYWSMVVTAFVLLLLPMLTGPVPLPPDALGTVTLVGVLVVVAAVTRLTERHIPRRPDGPPLSARQQRVWAVLGGVVSLAVSTTSVVAGDEILWAFAPAMIASLLVADLTPRRRRVAGAAMIAVAGAAGVAVGLVGGDDLLTAFPLTGALVTAFVLSLTLTTTWTWNVAVQLDAARRTAATLAITNERLRFAADLHDIQGHHLQVIARKSELAGRLLRTDPDAAEREMSAVQQLASDALHDTRAVVHGYRRATLDAELTNASHVLASGGIDSHLRLDPDVHSDLLPETSRHLLGLVLREAITNILRHSTATRAEVILTCDEHVELTVTNDGADPDDPGRVGGLGDLAERLRAAGGTLTWDHSGGGFQVHARLPADPAALSASGDAS